MGDWCVIGPMERTNFCPNPSLEVNATGWSALTGSTISRSGEKAFRGGWSLKCVTGGANQGVDTPSYTGTNLYLGLSAAIYAPTGAIITVAVSVGGVVTVLGTVVGDNEWHWVQYAHNGGAGSAAVLMWFLANIACTFYVDAVQYEKAANASLDTSYWYSTYIDGDQVDCHWNGIEHGSTSTRLGSSRNGGLIYDLEDVGFYVTDWFNMGAGPQVLKTQPNPTGDGVVYEGQRSDAAEITLVGDLGDISSGNLSDLQANRLALWNLIKPDLVEEARFWLRYTGGDRPVQMRVSYVGGMEEGKVEGYVEGVGLRLFAAEPVWYELGGGAAALTTILSEADADYVIQRVNGVWSDLATGLNGAVYAIAIGPDGCAYLGGAFTNAGGVADADYLCKWDGTAFSAVSATVLNAAVRALGFGPDGTLYIAGDFTNAGGDAQADYLVKLVGSTISGLVSTAINAPVVALAVGTDGYLYIAGNFTSVDGDAGLAYLACMRTDGVWIACGTPNVNIYCLAVGPDGALYVGGNFTGGGGVTGASYIYKFLSGVASRMGGSGDLNAAVRAIVVGRDGSVYAGGDFTNAAGVGDADHAARYNGVTWQAMGSGVNGNVYGLFLIDDLIYATGVFTTAGGLSLADRIAIWNGSSWAPVDVDLPGTPTVYAVAKRNTTITIGFSTSGTANASCQNTVTNAGSRRGRPVIRVKVTAIVTTVATIAFLENVTTGKKMWLNYATAVAGEMISIDLQSGTIKSNYYGNVLGRAIIRGSSFSDWTLQAGANLVNVYVAGDATIEAWMEWTPAHGLMDGCVR